jgi:hypothetical protein
MSHISSKCSLGILILCLVACCILLTSSGCTYLDSLQATPGSYHVEHGLEDQIPNNPTAKYREQEAAAKGQTGYQFNYSNTMQQIK